MVLGIVQVGPKIDNGHYSRCGLQASFSKSMTASMAITPLWGQQTTKLLKGQIAQLSRKHRCRKLRDCTRQKKDNRTLRCQCEVPLSTLSCAPRLFFMMMPCQRAQVYSLFNVMRNSILQGTKWCYWWVQDYWPNQWLAWQSMGGKALGYIAQLLHHSYISDYFGECNIYIFASF